MKDTVYLMKKELESYSVVTHELRKLKQQIQLIENELEGVSSVPWDKVGKKESATYSEQRRLGLIEQKEKLHKQEKLYLLKLRYVDDFMEQLEDNDKKLIQEKYIRSKSYGELSRLYNLTERQLRQNIDTIIELAV